MRWPSVEHLIYKYLWVWGVCQSLHFVGMVLLIGTVGILDLRLLGVSFASVPVSSLLRRILPWTKLAFAVMVVSGVLLFYAIPVRSYQSIWFRTKMVLLILAGLNAWVFHHGAYLDVDKWNLDRVPPSRAPAPSSPSTAPRAVAPWPRSSAPPTASTRRTSTSRCSRSSSR